MAQKLSILQPESVPASSPTHDPTPGLTVNSFYPDVIDISKSAFKWNAKYSFASAFQKFKVGLAGIRDTHIRPGTLIVVESTDDWGQGAKAFAYDLAVRSSRGRYWNDGNRNPRGKVLWLKSSGNDETKFIARSMTQFGGVPDFSQFTILNWKVRGGSTLASLKAY